MGKVIGDLKNVCKALNMTASPHLVQRLVALAQASEPPAAVAKGKDAKKGASPEFKPLGELELGAWEWGWSGADAERLSKRIAALSSARRAELAPRPPGLPHAPAAALRASSARRRRGRGGRAVPPVRWAPSTRAASSSARPRRAAPARRAARPRPEARSARARELGRRSTRRAKLRLARGRAGAPRAMKEASSPRKLDAPLVAHARGRRAGRPTTSGRARRAGRRAGKSKPPRPRRPPRRRRAPARATPAGDGASGKPRVLEAKARRRARGGTRRARRAR